eukprot:3519882-Rhodomonas_salina.1
MHTRSQPHALKAHVKASCSLEQRNLVGEGTWIGWLLGFCGMDMHCARRCLSTAHPAHATSVPHYGICTAHSTARYAIPVRHTAFVGPGTWPPSPSKVQPWYGHSMCP